MTTKIALDGVGGQGVRLIAGIMGSLLARMGKQVTVLFDYDSSVRGSMSDAFLIFDDEPIANPVVEEADIMLKLADKGHLRISGRKVVADLGLDVPGAEQIPFASLGSEHFGKELFGNMIALGRILRLAEIEFDEDAIRESLPRRYVEENVAAIRFGYDLTDEDIARLAAAAPPSRFQMNTAATAAGSPVGIGIVIREARPEDAGVIAEIWLASFKATYGFPPAHPDDDVRAWVRRLLLPETDTWIAEEERGAAIGFISIGDRVHRAALRVAGLDRPRHRFATRAPRAGTPPCRPRTLDVPGQRWSAALLRATRVPRRRADGRGRQRGAPA